MEASGPGVQQHKVPQDRRSPAAIKSSRASPSLPLEPLSGAGRRTGQEKSSTPGLNCPAYSREGLSPGLEMWRRRRTVLWQAGPESSFIFLLHDFFIRYCYLSGPDPNTSLVFWFNPLAVLMLEDNFMNLDPYGPVLTPILQKILYLTHGLHNFSLYIPNFAIHFQ